MSRTNPRRGEKAALPTAGAKAASAKTTAEKRSAGEISDSSGRSGDETPPKKKSKDATIADLKSKMLDKNTKIQTMRGEIKTLKDVCDLQVVKIGQLEEAAINPPIGVPINKGFKMIVDKETKGPVWQKNKFIANAEELDKLMKKVMLDTDHGAEAWRACPTQNRPKWFAPIR